MPWYENEFSKLSDVEIEQKIEYSRLKCKKARMSHIYKRLDGNRPSYTITGSGGGVKSVIKIFGCANIIAA